mgnify:CR=1 FL=1
MTDTPIPDTPETPAEPEAEAELEEAVAELEAEVADDNGAQDQGDPADPIPAGDPDDDGETVEDD